MVEVPITTYGDPRLSLLFLHHLQVKQAVLTCLELPKSGGYAPMKPKTLMFFASVTSDGALDLLALSTIFVALLFTYTQNSALRIRQPSIFLQNQKCIFQIFPCFLTRKYAATKQFLTVNRNLPRRYNLSRAKGKNRKDLLTL